MSVDSREVGDVLTAYFTEKELIDQVQIPEIGKKLMSLIFQCRNSRMLVNFRGVKLMSSVMLGEMVRINNKCKTSEVDLRLCEIPPNIMEIFTITTLADQFKIQPTEEQALASF